MSLFTPLRPGFALLRPHQWVKNTFVFAGLLFGHAWQSPEKLSAAIAAFAAFSLFASAIYVMNDLVDREQDRQHPKKKFRPLAAGTISVSAALTLGATCFVAGSVLALGYAGSAPWIFFAYFAINIAYSFWLKHVVILDVFLISAGFMLRLLAGTLGLGIAPSHWLLLCGLLLTLFLGFAKRRSELAAVSGNGSNGGSHRRVLTQYNSTMLDQFISIAAAGTTVSYALYTVSAETIALHGTTHLIYTVPFVLYGLLRYLWRVHSEAGDGEQGGPGGGPSGGPGGGTDAASELLHDRHLQVACLGWLAVVVAILA